MTYVYEATVLAILVPVFLVVLLVLCYCYIMPGKGNKNDRGRRKNNSSGIQTGTRPGKQNEGNPTHEGKELIINEILCFIHSFRQLSSVDLRFICNHLFGKKALKYARRYVAELSCDSEQSQAPEWIDRIREHLQGLQDNYKFLAADLGKYPKFVELVKSTVERIQAQGQYDAEVKSVSDDGKADVEDINDGGITDTDAVIKDDRNDEDEDGVVANGGTKRDSDSGDDRQTNGDDGSTDSSVAEEDTKVEADKNDEGTGNVKVEKTKEAEGMKKTQTDESNEDEQSLTKEPENEVTADGGRQEARGAVDNKEACPGGTENDGGKTDTDAVIKDDRNDEDEDGVVAKGGEKRDSDSGDDRQTNGDDGFTDSSVAKEDAEVKVDKNYEGTENVNVDVVAEGTIKTDDRADEYNDDEQSRTKDAVNDDIRANTVGGANGPTKAEADSSNEAESKRKARAITDEETKSKHITVGTDTVQDPRDDDIEQHDALNEENAGGDEKERSMTTKEGNVTVIIDGHLVRIRTDQVTVHINVEVKTTSEQTTPGRPVTEMLSEVNITDTENEAMILPDQPNQSDQPDTSPEAMYRDSNSNYDEHGESDDESDGEVTVISGDNECEYDSRVDDDAASTFSQLSIDDQYVPISRAPSTRSIRSLDPDDGVHLSRREIQLRFTRIRQQLRQLRHGSMNNEVVRIMLLDVRGNEHLVHRLIQIIFAKTLQMTENSVYAELCRRLAAFPSGENMECLKELLLDECRKELEKTRGNRKNWDIRRSNFVNFLTELFKRRMIPYNFIHSCLQQFLSYEDQRELLHFCNLFTATSEKISPTFPAVPARIRGYFRAVRELLRGDRLSPEVRDRLREFLEIFDGYRERET